MIEYTIEKHSSGKMRLLRTLSGLSKFVCKGKQRYFTDALELSKFIEKLQLQDTKKMFIKRSNSRTMVNV